MTTELGSDLRALRLGAIEASGWGARFRLLQPRNLAFWVYLLLVGLGVLVYGLFVTAEVAVYAPALTVALLLFTLYGALFWWFTAHIDRYAGLPANLLVWAFVWGAFAASGAIASNANTPLIDLYGKWFGPAFAQDWGAGLAAPFVEELSKGAGLLLLLVLGRRVVRTAFDGFILGAFCGLGFQVLEDVLYAVSSAGEQFGANQITNALSTIQLRMETGFFSHILYSAVFGAGLLWFLGTPAEPRRRGRGLLVMLTAMALHGLWDSAAGVLGALGVGSTAAIITYWSLVAALAVITVLTVFRMAIPRERGFVHAVLAPEVETGTLTAEELDTLAGDAAARRLYRRGASDLADRRRRAHRLAAGHDLADELARDRGRDTPRVQHARAELARFAGHATPTG
jgi:protease PrsW